MNRLNTRPTQPQIAIRFKGLAVNWATRCNTVNRSSSSNTGLPDAARFGRLHRTRNHSLGLDKAQRAAQASLLLKSSELDEACALANQIGNKLSDPIFVKDRQGRYLAANTARLQALGLVTVTQILGRTDAELLPADQAALIDQAEQQVFLSGQGIENQEEVLANLGTGTNLDQRYFLTSRIPLRDERGQVVGLLGLGKEITEMKRAQRQVGQAKAEAEAANLAKSLFLANMSHELRTPLNAIIGMTGLLLESSLTNEQEEFLNIVQASGDTLITLINDILDLNKIEAGKMELETMPLDLRSIIEEALDLVAARASAKRLDLAYIIEDGTPGTILGDPTRLSQILVNLLSNAVKFTDHGEVVVSVAAQRAAQGSGIYELRFAVRDTGIGIDQEKIDHLFQPFTQLGAATTRLYGGTGLGLAISKRLSELMGGRIWAESRPQQGSTFYFTVNAQAASSQIKVYLQSTQPELRGKHILIVDDNSTNRRILKKQTESWGMKASTAHSGTQALAWLAQGTRFDLAILDMKMPDMDGVMLAKALRKALPSPHLPLILLSSMGSPGLSSEGEVSDLFQATVTKPIKPSQLYNVLMETLQSHSSSLRRPATGQMAETDLGQRHPLHILLAEDNAINQKVALHMLHHLGYQADLAGDGAQVLEALEKKQYDLIFMDVQMPMLDGLEASRIIRRRMADAQRPRIVAMTANATESDRQACLDAGMDDYISKPFQIDRLATALKQCSAQMSVVSGTDADANTDTDKVSPAPSGGKLPHARINQRNNGAGPLPSRSETVRPVDPETFHRLYDFIGDDPETLAELILSFITDTSKLVDRMVAALPTQDTQTLTRTAHTLKSGSAMFGALTMSTLCQDVESLGHSGKMTEVTQKVGLLEAEFGRVRSYLEHRHLHRTH